MPDKLGSDVWGNRSEELVVDANNMEGVVPQRLLLQRRPRVVPGNVACMPGARENRLIGDQNAVSGV